ncbi:MAG: InlB B-repeat-containing protein [Candidatus Limivicinus sp.]
MKSARHNYIASAAMALALVAVFAWASPAAYAGHTGHEGWAAISTGSRKTLENGSYYLKDDLNSDLVIKGDVELCLNGHRLSGSGNGSVITVAEGARLSLHDCGKGGCVTGGKATEGGGIYVAKGAGLTLEGGSISGNQANRGGGICAADGASVTVTGGEICDNSAKNGGGLFLRCEASIQGSKIHGNSAEYTGAGLYAEMAEGGSIDLNACSIEGNTGLGHGGGIYLKSCQATAEACRITGNAVTSAHASGGGVYIDEYAGFTMTGGTLVSGNSAANQGGGICVSSAPAAGFTMDGGEISGNSAINGGGISSTGVGSFDITGGKIAQNNASGDGGGVYVSFAFTRDTAKNISHCDIDGNTAGNYGGGMFVQGNSFISMELSGSSIRRNNAMDGGGVYVEQMDKLSLSGRLHINGNQCSGRGANLYLHSSNSMYVSGLEQGSDIGLSIEYTDKNTFTKDAAADPEMLKACFRSNVADFGISIGADHELQFALTCQVDFDAKGGKLDKAYQVYTTGDPLGSLPVPRKDGYTFTYWDYNGKKVSPEDPVTFNKTLTANYEFNHYTVNFDPNGGSGSMASQKCRYTVPFNLSKCGFRNGELVFAGWSLSPDGPVEYADGGSACSLCTVADGSVTLYAQWKQAPASAIRMAESVKLAMGESRTLSVTAEPAGADISDITWSCDKEKVLSVDARGRVTGLSAGTATVTASTPAGASASCTVEVGRRAVDQTDFVFSEERSFPYDGQAKSPQLLSFPQGLELDIHYLDSDGSPVDGLPSQPGSYSISIDVKANKSFDAAQGITDSSWSFTIEQGRQQALTITGQPDSVCFGQAFTLSTEGGSGDGTVSWAITAGDAALVNSDTGDVYVTGVGSFTVTATKQGNGSFDDATASASFTAGKRQLYLETQPTVVTEKIYDGTTLSQVLDMGQVAGFRPEDEGSVSLEASARFENKNAGMGKAVVVSYTLGNLAEYYEAPQAAYVYGGAIYPLAVSLRWNYSAPFTYNCCELRLSATVANAIEGDSVSCAAYEGAAGVDAGDYLASVTALDNPNYTLDGAEGNSLSWRIDPRTVTVKAADLHKVYGEADPAFYTISMDEEPPVLTGELVRDYGEDVGAYYIRQGSLTLTDGPGFAAANYVLDFVDGLLTVDAAGNDIYSLYCDDVPYGGQPSPGAQAAFGQVNFSYSQDPDGWFGPWDADNSPGLWYVKASVDGTHNYSGAETLGSFTVLNEQLQAFEEPASIHLGAGENMTAMIAAALPQELGIINTRWQTSQYRAQVWWDIDNIGYDPAVQGAQVLTVYGTAVLPAAVENGYGLPMDVSIQVYIDPSIPVLAEEPVSLSLPPADGYLGLS